MTDHKKVTDIGERIAARVAEEQQQAEHGERLYQGTRIYLRAIKEMLALGLDKPAVVRLLHIAIEALEE
jgi:hypothetical protein